MPITTVRSRRTNPTGTTPAARRLHLSDQRLAARAHELRPSFLGLSSGGQNGVYTTDFQRTTPFIALAPNNVDPGTPWANPFPDGFLQPLAGELGLLTALGTGPTIPNPDYEIPYADQWMAGVDIQLPWNIGLDVAYVGNQVSKLGVTRNVNSCRDRRTTRRSRVARRQHRVSQRDLPESVCRAGARAGPQRRHRVARAAPPPVSAVHAASR